MKRYIGEIPSSEYILLGIDHTAWGRKGAKTLKDILTAIIYIRLRDIERADTNY